MTTALTINLPTGHGAKRHRPRRPGLARAVSGLVEVLDRVGRWMTENDARLKKAFLVPTRDGLSLYVIPRSAAYDHGLTDALCDLTIEFADAGIDISGSQIPDGTSDELAAFFDPGKALLLSRV